MLVCAPAIVVGAFPFVLDSFMTFVPYSMKSLLLPMLTVTGLLLTTSCIPDPVLPDWQADFEAVADTSSDFPEGSSLLRCYWNDEWVYLVENPLNSCVACEVITAAGDTISLASTEEQLDYLENRRRCEQVWRKD